MSEQVANSDSKELSRAQELLENPRIAWHSVNGFDFWRYYWDIGTGIEPYTQFGGKEAISLASSPADPTVTKHPTFNYYVPKSISFPVPRHGSKAMHEDSHDELQYEGPIPKSEIYGIMIPAIYSPVRLSELPVLKPPMYSRTGAYIDRQLNSLDILGGDIIDNAARDELSSWKDKYRESYDDYDDRKALVADMNKYVLTLYEKAISHLTGINKPTLHNTTQYLAERYGIGLFILPSGFEA